MATNTFHATANTQSTSQPLRGDMAVSFDFIPPDGWVRWFHTEDANQFVFSSNSANFRRFGGATPGPTMTVGGANDLFYKFQYDKTKNQFKVTATNQTGTGSGSGGTGPGTPGEAASITIGTVQAGPTAQVTNTGTPNDAVLNFTLPQGPKGDKGDDGDPGEDGATFPEGGNTGDLLARTGPGVVGWVAAPSGGTGGTGGTVTEKSAALNANKHLIIEKATHGTSVIVTLSENVALFPEPTGYLDGEIIHLTVKFAGVGGWKINKYGNNFLFFGAQPPTLPSVPGAMCEFRMKRTDGGKWMTRVEPDKTFTDGYGLITAIARNAGIDYYAMGDAYNAAASGSVVTVIRSGKGSESIGTVGSDANGNPKTLTIAGVAQSDGSRPTLLVYPDTRLAFQKGIINIEAGNVTIRDLILNGARNLDATSRGISLNGATVTMRNLLVENCENGTLWGEITESQLIEDCWFNNNGQAGQAHAQGYTHNIYAGSGSGTLTVRRSSFTKARYGHDFKTRMARTIIERCLMQGADAARELDCPNGGILEISDTRFWKDNPNATQGNLVSIGQEGIQGDRPRAYTFRNCEFRIDIPNVGRDVTFVWNGDPDVDVYLIDCTFIGEGGLATNTDMGTGLPTINGLRGRVIKQFTSGVTPGPRFPVGYQAQIIGVNGSN